MNTKILSTIVILSLVFLAGCQNKTAPDNASKQVNSVNSTDVIKQKIEKDKLVCFASFKKLQQNNKYEFNLLAMGQPNAILKANLSGPGLVDESQKDLIANDQGKVEATWKINKSGFYSISVTGELNGQAAGECNFETEVK